MIFKPDIWKQAGIDVVAAQAGRLFLWLPVALGGGVATYLLLPFEPGWRWIVPPFVVLLAIALLVRRFNSNAYLASLIALLLMASAGMLIGKWRAEAVKAPVLAESQQVYGLRAFVIDNLSTSTDAPRLLLAPIEMPGIPAGRTPLRLRVTLRPGAIEAANIKPGDAISTFALVDPPPGPLLPGGYDFARGAYFQGIGGVGFIPGAPHKIVATPRGWRLVFILWLNRLRWDLTETIVRSVAPAFKDGGALGGFAAALVTGEQAFVPQSLIQDMRDSGLAHILSISGVHMAIVGGFVFFTLRAVMALIPWLALRASIKKIAAALSIIAVFIYLAISGVPAPAVRAAVVACVAFTAILFDRQAISLRALAIAALIVILLTPEAVIQPGFQMSFCATAALLAFAEAEKAPIREIQVPAWVKAFQAAVRGLWLSLLASITATAATTPFAIAYFNRFSVYGLLSNLFEAPITAFIVMPCLAAGSVFAATPLGPLALRFSACGLWLIARIANWTAHLPGAVIHWPSAPDYVLGISFAGIIWICLIRGWLRWLGLIAALSILYWPRLPTPDIWVDAQGGNAAIRTGNTVYVMRDARTYGAEQWAQRFGLTLEDQSARDRAYDCTRFACTPWPDSKLRVGFWFSNKPPSTLVLTTLCLNSDLVIVRNNMADWPADCAGINHISAGDFRRLGALELTRVTVKGRGEWQVKAAQPLRGNRYWSIPSGAEADGQ
ncbi:MAG TPA: ComEC/Rec2 family competence protein [Asticcacaulis sp.]|nr:ComEC/Rec2 family competence protein [Asticcacaulis sp.]